MKEQGGLWAVKGLSWDWRRVWAAGCCGSPLVQSGKTESEWIGDSRNKYGVAGIPEFHKNFIGLDKGLPVPEMEKLMLTHLEVKEEDLRDLASQRSRKVKDFLSKEGKVEPERIFLVEPKSLSPEKKENLKNSRVVFSLK
jgi:hypothetical protein